MRNANLIGLIAGSMILTFPAMGQEVASVAVKPSFNVNSRIAAAFGTTPNAVTVIPEQSTKTKRPECGSTDPKAVSKLVREIAAEEGVDPDLADAVAWVESQHGAARHASAAGAVGIMQLMPGTAADLGVTDRCDIEANIRGGVKYLKKLYTEFGDPLLMLAAYNAGPGNVYKKQGIPEFDETTKYVVKVLNRWKLSAMVAPKQTAKITTTNGEKNSENPWKDGHVIEVQ